MIDQNIIRIFGIEFSIDRVAFTIPVGNGYNVYWYGIIIAVGVMLAMIYGFRSAKRFGIDPDRMSDVVIVSIIGSIICARLYYVIFDSNGTYSSFMDVIDITKGGLAIYGGVIGAFGFGALMCKLRKVNVLSMFDLAGTGFLLGQAIGRWGNFVNQEAYGGFTGSSWFGITGGRIASEMGSTALVHPCFLYESVWCLIGFFVLHYIGKRRKYNGQVILSYCAWYGFGRFFIEGLRTDSLHIGLNLRVSQLLSAILFIGATITLIYMHFHIKERAVCEYSPMFGEIEEGDGTDAEQESVPSGDDPDNTPPAENIEETEKNDKDN